MNSRTPPDCSRKGPSLEPPRGIGEMPTFTLIWVSENRSWDSSLPTNDSYPDVFTQPGAVSMPFLFLIPLGPG